MNKLLIIHAKLCFLRLSSDEKIRSVPFLKVSKFQKQIFMLSFEPKTERNYFLIFALASKNGSSQKNKGTLLY